MDFGIVAGIAGKYGKIVGGKEHSRTARRSGEGGEIERVPNRDVLQPDERSILDPAIRVDRRLADCDAAFIPYFGTTAKGDTIQIAVAVDHADEIHLHGYDLTREIIKVYVETVANEPEPYRFVVANNW